MACFLYSGYCIFTITLHLPETEGQPGVQEVRNERALFVYNRVQHKLTGTFLELILTLWHTEYNSFRSRFQPRGRPQC